MTVLSVTSNYWDDITRSTLETSGNKMQSMISAKLFICGNLGIMESFFFFFPSKRLFNVGGMFFTFQLHGVGSNVVCSV